MNSAGGIANGDESLYMLVDPNSGTSSIVLTINLSQTLADVRFSVFDIDNGVFGTGGVNSRQDSVRIIGYNGSTEIAPSLDHSRCLSYLYGIFFRQYRNRHSS